MTTYIIEFGTPAYDEAIQLRKEVLWRPLNLQFTPEDLEKEYNDIHIGCYNQQAELVACLTISNSVGNVAEFSQVVVSEQFQHQHIGTKMLNYAEEVAKTTGFKQIGLSAKDKAVPFYKKLDYEIFGDGFSVKGIKHFYMIKKL